MGFPKSSMPPAGNEYSSSDDLYSSARDPNASRSSTSSFASSSVSGQRLRLTFVALGLVGRFWVLALLVGAFVAVNFYL
jgi:hypothetical protein